jgi:hypothetical protein
MSKFSCYFFGNPTDKTGTAHMWELLIANHLDQLLWSTNQNYRATVRSNLVHSFLEVHSCVEPFTSHGKLHEFGAEKPIFWAKQAHFGFLAINFTDCSQILSTGGDAFSPIQGMSKFIVSPLGLVEWDERIHCISLMWQQFISPIQWMSELIVYALDPVQWDWWIHSKSNAITTCIKMHFVAMFCEVMNSTY